MEDPMKPWAVVALRLAKREGRKLLTDVQYEHVKEIEKRLAWWPYREEISDLDLLPVGEIFELREKGGPLGRINLRVYFGVWEDLREIVILKTYKKEQENQISRHIVIGAEDRFDDYKAGLLGVGRTVYTPRSRPK